MYTMNLLHIKSNIDVNKSLNLCHWFGWDWVELNHMNNTLFY